MEPSAGAAGAAGPLPSDDELEAAVRGIIAGCGDLASITTGAVRKQLAERFACDLMSRKVWINELISVVVNEAPPADAAADEEASEGSSSASESGSESTGSGSSGEGDGEEGGASAAGAPPKKKRAGKVLQASTALADFLGGRTHLTFSEAAAAIRSYVTANNLVNPDNRSEWLVDEKLAPVFKGRKRVGMFKANKYISANLKDPAQLVGGAKAASKPKASKPAASSKAGRSSSSGGGGGKAKGGAGEAGEGGKKAVSAYMHFVQATRPAVIADNPDATFGQVGKLLGQRWAACSASEKARFEGLAAADRARALAEGCGSKAAKKAEKKRSREEAEGGGGGGGGDGEGGAKKKRGWAMPRISPELAALPTIASRLVGGKLEMARGDVVKAIWEHIKQHSLQNPSNKKEILCDAALTKIMGHAKVDMLSMNKYIQRHFNAEE